MSYDPGILLQLDIEKAFDSVSWDYLYEVLNNFSFPDTFMQWVKTLYFNKEIRIINNGFVSDPISPSNGLAQGDGLSPLLFVLVIETLALTIRANAKIQGYQAGMFHKKLALLADDMILSLKAKQVTFSQVLLTLQDFANISNLRVNSEKSATFAIGPKEKSKQINIEPFIWKEDVHCDYLGIPVLLQHNEGQVSGTIPIPATDLLRLVDSTLYPRNSPEHTLLGQALNIHALFASKLNYYFSLSCAPTDKVLRKVQSHINHYLWSYRKHHVTDQLLYEPFETGGINLYSIITHNRTVKLKALNKLVCNTNEFWRASLQNIFKLPLEIICAANLKIKHLSWLKHSFETTLPFFWQQAFQIWTHINFNGKNQCTKDMLVISNSLLPLKTLFASDKMLELYNKGIHTLEDFMANSTKSTFIEKALRLISLCIDLTQFVTIPIRCNLDTPITCAAISRFLRKQNGFKPDSIWTKWAQDLSCMQVALEWPNMCKIRHDFVSVKLQSFYWKFINRAISTNRDMVKMKIIASPMCSFCKVQEETFMHLFWECDVVKDLWSQLIQWCKNYVDKVFVYSPSTCLLLGAPGKPVLNNVFLICKYYIHLQRVFKESLYFEKLLCRIKNVRFTDVMAYEKLPYLSIRKVYRLWGNIPSVAFECG